MNEFIVWDNFEKKFSEDNVRLTAGGGVTYGECYYGGIANLEGQKFTICNYIGIKDTNNNKIYADSSIVEFLLAIPNQPQVRLRGYFFMSEHTLGYEIQVFGMKMTLPMDLRTNVVTEINIIDTIQENKLGLIRWPAKAKTAKRVNVKKDVIVMGIKLIATFISVSINYKIIVLQYCNLFFIFKYNLR